MLKRNWRVVYTLLVIVGDLVLLNAAFRFALWLRFPEMDNPLMQYWEPLVVSNLLFFPLAVILGMYRSVHSTPLNQQKQYLKKLVYYLGILTMAYLYLTKGHEYSRGVVIIFFMATYMMLEIWHSVMFKFNNVLYSKGYGNQRVLIVGTDFSALRFSELLQDTYGDLYRIAGFIANGHPNHHPGIEPHIVGKYHDVDRLISEQNIDKVFIVSDSMREKKYDPIRKACEKHGVTVKMVSPDIKRLMRGLKVKDITGVPLSTNTRRYRATYWQARLKRAFDLLVVSLVSVILLPLSLIIAALIKLTSKGPVLFKQRRALYKGGPEFMFYKFRTMYENADEIKEKYLQQNESNGALFKMKNDPRVTPIGRWLRKYSLDEIPQFINVLKGEMSIVGPRPLPVKDFDLIENGKLNYDWYVKRGNIKPGITGLWQVSGRSNLTFEEMCLLDLYYIENQNLFFDLEILFETIPVAFFGKGAY
jgi:exopolysaccharide biosynthesis polyprenyl glycosylphosphotransferase